MTTINSITLPLLPLPNSVLFPEMVVTVAAETERSRAVLDAARTIAADNDRPELVAVPEHDGDYSSVGVVVRIEQDGPLPGGGEGVVLRVLRRVRIGQGQVNPDGVLLVSVTELEVAPPSAEAAALAEDYRDVATQLLHTIGGRRLAGLLDGLEDPGALADSIG